MIVILCFLSNQHVKLATNYFKMFPRGNKNNRNRASRLLNSGDMQYSIIQHEYCKSRLKNNLETLSFRIDAAPSVKGKARNETVRCLKEEIEDHHTVFLAFNLNMEEILFYPYYACGCYNGRHVCSHFAAFLLLIRCIQRCDLNQDQFEKSLPCNPLNIKNCITLIEHVGYSGQCKISRRKKLE